MSKQPTVRVQGRSSAPGLKSEGRLRRGYAAIGYWLLVIGYLGFGVDAKAGDILRGNTGTTNSAATSTFYGGNQAAMTQLQNNARDILARAAQAMKSAQAMQQAARNAALQGLSTVPNGLATGGLQIATGKNAEWKGANQPAQSVSNGQTTVTIQQTASQAILNWQSFNVGKNTTVDFNQSAGGAVANTWVALNRIFSGTPSQILGSIKAQGQVYLINQNGIIFGGTSQVNVGTLLAAAARISDSQFTTDGIYTAVTTSGLGSPGFTGGLGSVIVDSGAQLVTNAPLRTGDRGGSVILLGQSVENAGSIITTDGQTVLAAGKDFSLLPGYSIVPGTSSVSSSAGNETSTTLGAEIQVTSGGTTLNTGVIEATTGDITMVGHQVTQSGVMIATSSVDQRGTIHLLTSTADATSSVTLAPNSVTYIAPDPNSGTALDPQQTAALTEDIAYLNATPHLNDQAQLPDRIGISRIEITTGGTVDFTDGSLTSATAGQIAVHAGKRVFVGNGAKLDVSGLVNVSLPMSDNNLAVNIQGFELRDSPGNRDTASLFNNTVYVDLRQLVEVPANSSYNAPYNTENRYYTPGGLLEVSGELNNVGHSIDEWDTIGGAITLSANQVIAQKGSVFDVAGGSIRYQGGYLKESYVIASDGRIYNVNTAPAGITYIGVFNGFVVNHPHWNVTETYANVITQPSQIYVPGYTEGRDAGSLTINARTSIFEGTIDAQTVDGPQQDSARPSNVTDPFLLTESTVTLNGSLVLGPESQVNNGVPYSSNVVFADNNSSLTANLTATSPLNNNLFNTNTFSASQISSAQLGGLTIDVAAAIPKSKSGTSNPHEASSSANNTPRGAKGYLTIADPLAFANGAQISLTAANVVIDGNITAPDGTVSIDAVSYNQSANVTSTKPARAIAGITVGPNIVIDTAGLWTNAFLDPSDITGEAYINGGNVRLSSNQGITLSNGSLIDASSGAAILPNLKTLDGSGGNISIEADQVGNVTPVRKAKRTLLTVAQAVSKGALVLDGTLQSYGVKAGGALTLQAYSVIIGNGITAAKADQLVLPTSLFSQGFSSYTIHGMVSLAVAPGADINVTEPVYQFSAASYKTPTGATITTAMGNPLLMPVYVGNPDTATVTQRPGASLSLLAGVNGNLVTTSNVAAGGTINIGAGSTINVDPGQSIDVEGAGQITVDGRLRAPSGSIEIVNYRPLGGVGGSGKTISYEPHGLSIWIGSDSELDVAAQAFVALDRFGRPYGVVPNGGLIVLGSAGGTRAVQGTGDFEIASTDAFVIIRPGATLDASGTSAVLDLDAGANPTEGLGGTSVSIVRRDPVYVASNGGSISLSSYDGIYIDGTLEAASGGPGGAGGTLAITFAGPIYQVPPLFAGNDTNTDALVPDNLRAPRTIVIGQDPVPSDLPSSLEPGQGNSNLKVGYAYLSANAPTEGGFANLSLFAANSILFKGNVTLRVGESMELSATSLADTSRHAQVEIAAPYVLLTTPAQQYPDQNGNAYGYGVEVFGSVQTLGNVPGQTYGRADLTVNADLIDLGSAVFGDFENSISSAGYAGRTINFPGFKDVNFVSEGDIRFLSNATVSSPGSLTFTAVQLYPVSGGVATVEAGFASLSTSNFAPGTSISIYRINAVDPAVPQSVFGQITFEAETINQGGIVRAPLGLIVFGANPSGSITSPTKAVNFLPGSITSVSANGLTIPYGGTTDGVIYNVDGKTFTTGDVVDAASGPSATVNRGITIQGYSASVSSGALLDLSGGGNLFGEGFISGRGGSLDVLSTPLINQNPSYTFSASGNTVYAIVPGVQTYAPATVDTNTGYTGSMPGIGQQITIPAGVPGLPAGTYTLMPANYALLPGAFRVELGGRGNTNQPSALSLDNGSYEVDVNQRVANTGFRNAVPNEAIITPASAVGTYSEYDLETYTAVAVSQAQRFNQPRPVLPVDASTLTLQLVPSPRPESQLSFDGTADFSPGAGGYSGTLVISGNGSGSEPIAIMGPDSAPKKGAISLSASAIDAIGAPNIYIGGYLTLDTPGKFQVSQVDFVGNAGAVVIETGAILKAADVFLMSGNSGSITLESGATIDTLGMGAPAIDSTNGYFFTNSSNGSTFASPVIAVSNGYLNIQPAIGSTKAPITVKNGASLLSDGTIAFATNGILNLGENVNYGAKYIGFATASINIGTPVALSTAGQNGTLPTGLLLDQNVLDNLLRGDPAVGAPALEMLTLSASQSINFYGSINLNTVNPVTGKSTLQDLVFDTPAVYGAGTSSDTVTITTNTLIWNGLAQLGIAPGTGSTISYTNTPPGPVIAGGPGTGSGTFDIVANEIVFGYAPQDERQNITSLDRLVLGFSTVNLTAMQEITANSKGSFSVYLAETAPGTYTGGNLNLITPLLTGAPGSVLSYKTGGQLTLMPPAGIKSATAMSDSLGAEIDLSADTITDSTSILAASGKVTLTASGDISLNMGSRIDVSGLTVAMFDQKVPTFGGDVSLESTTGDITQDTSSIINVSAIGDNAGSLTITATGTSGGQVTLGGTLLGSSTGDFNGGSFDIRAQNFGDFTALNQILDTGGFFYSRSFDIKQGSIDIAAGTTIKAHTVDISVDNGSLTISGTIDASGATPGTIRLSANGNLELTSSGVLDVHSTVLQVDSYGQPIDAENQGVIELTVADGTNTSGSTLNNGQGVLLLDPGAAIDMSSPDGVARGDLELNVPRTGVSSGNVRIQAGGPLNIAGAETIAVNAFWTYAPADGTITQINLNSSGTPIDPNGIGLDQVNNDSTNFIKAALTDGALMSELAGLTAYKDAFHLRPGVEIVSATPNADLTVLGDLDLSAWRYASLNPNSPLTSAYGSGEPGVLILRAGGNLNVYGSINDGFAPLSLNGATLPDENGWVLFAGKPTLSNVVIETTGVTLVTGTKFSNDSVTLSYAISIGSAKLNSDVTIPVTVTLASQEKVATPFVATADITIQGGQVFHAGQIVPAGTVLPTGTTFASGSVLPFAITINPVTWPAGALLSDFAQSVILAANVTLQPGNLIPVGSTPEFAPGTKSVGTRPVTNGIQGQVYAVEQMLLLPNGQVPLSWSIRLIAGADTGAADTRVLQAQSALNGSGNLVLDDLHYSLTSNTPIFSVIRTGTGNLDLLAGGNLTEESLYGIYTAGAQTPTLTGPNGETFDSLRGETNGYVLGSSYQGTVYEYIADNASQGGLYNAYYPNGGGNVLVAAQGNLTGFSLNNLAGNYIPTYNVADWLWTQGGTAIGQSSAWWINFGTYVLNNVTGKADVTGFTGIGALGGGNVTVLAGGNAGVTTFSSNGESSGSLVIAVGGTGRVISLNGTGGSNLAETGGGNVTIEIGGALNPVAAIYNIQNANAFSGGNFIDLRGNVSLKAGSIGGIDLVYGQSSGADPRPTNVNTAAVYSFAFGGPELTPGDSAISLQVRGDLVLGNANDPGISPNIDLVNFTEATLVGDPSATGKAQSFFTLWTTTTAISAVSAGGNLVPSIGSGVTQINGVNDILYPSTLRLYATSGSIYAGAANSNVALELAPSPTGELELLAEQSIYTNALLGSNRLPANQLAIDISGASTGANDLPTPLDAAYYLFTSSKTYTNTFSLNGTIIPTPTLFAFELDSATGTLHADDQTPARIYAVTGDIVNLQFGQLLQPKEGSLIIPDYIGAKAVDIRAGGDIVDFGQSGSSPSFILNNSATDVSVVSAGNEILFANVDIAGPGNLEISAGGNVYQGDQGNIVSIGLIGAPKIKNPDGGAGIIVLAGVGSEGPNWEGFANLYLNPANVANPNLLLVDQPGKVVQTYQNQLLTWLQQNYGYKGSSTEALAYFESLPIEQQSIFLLQVYFSELNQSGLEYNDTTSPFHQSYLQGQEAIATLFPTTGANGQKITYNGSLTMFSGQSPTGLVIDSSILTDFGGGITTVVPGGQTIVGVTGVTPGAHAGILTQGAGNINMYSEGSVLLGESRILTTYGGNIVIWSGTGDINAGIGAKGTVIFAPAGIVYDDYNDIILSPTTPSSGAGIGTLDPIPDIPAGNVNLIAPEGTIDAGEAGIRASGNANLAARVIVNAANISVAGKTTGVPTIVSPNVAAITAASNAVGSSTNVAQEVAKQQTAATQQQVGESVIIVEVLGYGGGDSQ